MTPARFVPKAMPATAQRGKRDARQATSLMVVSRIVMNVATTAGIRSTQQQSSVHHAVRAHTRPVVQSGHAQCALHARRDPAVTVPVTGPPAAPATFHPAVKSSVNLAVQTISTAILALGRVALAALGLSLVVAAMMALRATNANRGRANANMVRS